MAGIAGGANTGQDPENRLSYPTLQRYLEIDQ
jgi:hypothetical protein